jgi:hypothetical protein
VLYAMTLVFATLLELERLMLLFRWYSVLVRLLTGSTATDTTSRTRQECCLLHGHVDILVLEERQYLIHLEFSLHWSYKIGLHVAAQAGKGRAK